MGMSQGVHGRWTGPYRIGGSGDMVWVSRDQRWSLSRPGADWRLQDRQTGEVYRYDVLGELFADLVWWYRNTWQPRRTVEGVL